MVISHPLRGNVTRKIQLTQFGMELKSSWKENIEARKPNHYVVKVTKNRVRPCWAVILPLTWGCTLLDCKSKKISSNMVRSGLKIRPKYEAYFIRQPIEGIILEKSLFHEKCSQLYT